MLRRLTATMAATLAILYTLAGAASALPGEGYGVDPYGIPMPDARPAAEPVLQTVSGMALSPILLAALIVSTAVVAAYVGYRAGAIHQRRLALR